MRRNSMEVLRETIVAAAEKVVVPDSVVKHAIEIAKPTQGYRLEVSALGALYYVIHTSKDCSPIGLDDFCSFLFSDPLHGARLKKGIAKIYRELYWEHDKKTEVCAIRPTVFVRRFLAELDASEAVTKVALDLNMKVIKARMHIGKTPPGVAAAIVYMAFILDGKRKVTQRALEDLSGMTQYAIRKTYQRIAEKLKLMEKMEINSKLLDVSLKGKRLMTP